MRRWTRTTKICGLGRTGGASALPPADAIRKGASSGDGRSPERRALRSCGASRHAHAATLASRLQRRWHRRAGARQPTDTSVVLSVDLIDFRTKTHSYPHASVLELLRRGRATSGPPTCGSIVTQQAQGRPAPLALPAPHAGRAGRRQAFPGPCDAIQAGCVVLSRRRHRLWNGGHLSVRGTPPAWTLRRDQQACLGGPVLPQPPSGLHLLRIQLAPVTTTERAWREFKSYSTHL